MTKAKTRKSNQKKARKDDKQESEVDAVAQTDETGTGTTTIQVVDVVRDDKGWNVKLPAILNKKIVSYAKYAWGAVRNMADRWAEIQGIAEQKQIDLEVCKEEFRYHARQEGMNRHQIDYALHAEQRKEDARIKRLEQKQQLEDANEIIKRQQEQEIEKERLNVKTPDEQSQNEERDDDVTIAQIENVVTDDEQVGVTTAELEAGAESAEMSSAKEEKEGGRTVIEIDEIGALKVLLKAKDQEIRKLQKQKGVYAEKEFTTEVSIPILDIVAQAQGISKAGYTSKVKKEFEKRTVIVNILIDLEAKTAEYLDLKVVEKQ